MARYLLDSNAFLWAKTEPQKIKQGTLEEIGDPKSQTFVSLATLWELALKSSKGKLMIFAEMIANQPLDVILAQSGLNLLEISLGDVMTAYRLPLFHRDPFDRMMIAQALNEGLTLVTSDATFSRYPGLALLKV